MGAQPTISYMYLVVYLIMVDMSFSPKFKCQTLLQGIFDATNIVIYRAVKLKNQRKKGSLIQFHVLPCNMG